MKYIPFLVIMLFLVVACAGPDLGDAPKTTTSTDAGDEENGEDIAAEEDTPVDLKENTFFITPKTSNADVKAVFEGKVEEYTIDTADVDLILFELKEKYDVSLNYVREHAKIEGLSYFDYQQKQEEKEEEGSGAVAPVRIQVIRKESQGKSTVEALFESGNIDEFTLNGIDKDVLNFDLADKYNIPINDVLRLTKYYNEGQDVPDINEIAEKLDEGLQESLVRKDFGTLRSVGCDFFNHIVTFQFMLEGDQNALLYGEITGPYTDKRVIRFKLNSQNLPNLVCNKPGEAAAVEFEPGVLYSCTNAGKGVYWKGEDERYADEPDVMAVQVVGGYDQLQFKCE